MEKRKLNISQCSNEDLGETFLIRKKLRNSLGHGKTVNHKTDETKSGPLGKNLSKATGLLKLLEKTMMEDNSIQADQLKRERSIKQKEMDLLNQKLISFAHKNENLTNEVLSVTNQNESLKEEVLLTTNKNESLKHQLSKLKEEIHLQNGLLRNQMEHIKKLESNSNEIQLQNTSLLKEKESLLFNLKNRDDVNSSLRTQNLAFRDSEVNQNRQIAELKKVIHDETRFQKQTLERVEQLESELGNVKKLLEESEKRNIFLQQEVQKKENVLDETRLKLNDCKDELSETKSRMRNYKDELNDAELKLNHVKKDLRDYKDELTRYHSKYRDCKDKLARYQSKYDSQRSRSPEYQSQNPSKSKQQPTRQEPRETFEYNSHFRYERRATSKEHFPSSASSEAHCQSHYYPDTETNSKNAETSLKLEDGEIAQ